MICIDELKSTFNRIILLQNNTGSVEEEIMANVIVQNLGPMLKQLEMMSGSPQFKQEVAEEIERRKHESEQPTETT
jgi:hypothetical protein